MDSYKVSHTRSYPEDTSPKVTSSTPVDKPLNREECLKQYDKMQLAAKHAVAKVYKHISSQSQIYNGNWQNEVSTKYHLNLANDCQMIVNIIPSNVNKWYKNKFKALFVELEAYFRDCGIAGRRLAKGPDTYIRFKTRIDNIW